jgi:high-affinity Fe2+/Pb2+ permease
MEMKDKNPWSAISMICAFLLGVILFWLFGKDWLNLESTLVFLAGLIGVAMAVLAFAARSIRHNSHHKEN